MTPDELVELFSGRSRFVDRLAQEDDPLGRARDIAHSLSEEEKVEALALHPRIGERSPEQHGDDPVVLVELATLNQVYEEKFGFRFVVFVAGRSREEILPVLRERLANTREQELDIALDELVAIAEDRWRQS
ncbi:MAG TPA: 2-oxo-4-hydroxy-4-carboxy-5-ureidoimidazoline decarboxylase [Gaiellaceae bacterium]|nr:2-oxo-4-hydroxy-4-carboxy-5-ureidoimidazoline decarboxylase [Gaiellaceae bacterium]